MSRFWGIIGALVVSGLFGIGVWYVTDWVRKAREARRLQENFERKIQPKRRRKAS